MAKQRDMGRATAVRMAETVSEWHREADVVVVGFGAAGACAALGAREAAGEVLVLERAGGGGGTSANSTGEVYLGEERITKRVIVDGARTHVSLAVYRGNDLNTLLYPVEASLENQGFVREIHLTYPQDRSVFLGLSSATWIFFAGSMVFGFALRGFFGVTF